MAISITRTHPQKFAHSEQMKQLDKFYWLPMGTLAVIVVTMLIGFAGHGFVRAQTSSATGTATGTPTATPAEGAYLGAVTNATTNGAVIVQIVPGSPAGAAGLQAGDVIQSVNGQAVSMTTPLGAILKMLSPGASALFVVARGNGWLPIRVTLGVRPTPTATPPLTNTPNGSSTKSANSGYLGIGLVYDGTNLQIARVADGSPAAVAGLQVNDVLVSIDGQPVQSAQQAQTILADKAPGQNVKLALMRNGQPLTVTVTLTVSPTATIPGAAQTPQVPAITGTPTAQSDVLPLAPRVQLGVTYDVVTPALAAAQNLSVTAGALIVTVIPGSPADVAGLKVGDVVTAVDGDKVDAKHTLAVRMVAYGPGDTLTLTVVRGGNTMQIPVTLAASGSA
ncbi:MAG: PDZ domain-containing protein [Aggregatilineales bacterium]